MEFDIYGVGCRYPKVFKHYARGIRNEDQRGHSARDVIDIPAANLVG